MRLIIFTFSFLYVFNIFSQDIKNKDVTVIEGFYPAIPDAEKIKEITDFTDTIIIDKSQEYNFIDKTIDANYNFRPLVAAKIKGEKDIELDKTKLIVGLGSHNTTRLNVLVNSLRKNNYSYGFLLGHLNSNFKIDQNKASSSKNYIKLFGKKIGDKNLFFADVEYQHNKDFLYGDLFSSDLSKNSFGYTKISVVAISKHISDSKLKHQTNFLISDLNQMSENRVHLGSVIQKKFNKYLVRFDLEADNYLNYNKEYSFNMTPKKEVMLFHAKPTTNIKILDVDITYGLSIKYISDEQRKFGVFPDIIATKELVKDILLVKGGIKSTMDRNTYKSFFDENPFIHALGINKHHIINDTTLDLRSTQSKEIFCVIRNVLGKDEVLNSGIYFGYIKNLPYFHNNFINQTNQFLIGYEDVWQIQANLDYEWRITDLLGLKVNAKYYNWYHELISKREDFILQHRANIEADASIFVNLEDKIKLNTSINYLGKRKVLDSSEDIIFLPSQFHTNIHLDYNYTSKIRAFLRINNITNSRKDIWQGYKEVGINLVGGIGYSF